MDWRVLAGGYKFFIHTKAFWASLKSTKCVSLLTTDTMLHPIRQNQSLKRVTPPVIRNVLTVTAIEPIRTEGKFIFKQSRNGIRLITNLNGSLVAAKCLNDPDFICI